MSPQLFIASGMSIGQINKRADVTCGIGVFINEAIGKRIRMASSDH